MHKLHSGRLARGLRESSPAGGLRTSMTVDVLSVPYRDIHTLRLYDVAHLWK